MSPTITRIYRIRDVLRDISEGRDLQDAFTFSDNLTTTLELVRQQVISFAFVDNLDYTINSESPAAAPLAFPEAEGYAAGATVGQLT